MCEGYGVLRAVGAGLSLRLRPEGVAPALVLSSRNLCCRGQAMIAGAEDKRNGDPIHVLFQEYTGQLL